MRQAEQERERKRIQQEQQKIIEEEQIAAEIKRKEDELVREQ